MADAQPTCNAGPFSQWLADTRAGKSAAVPCGDCNACCRAAYFIHIRANETAALDAVPAPLRFAAPGAATGEQVMGFDEQGSCPMLQQGACSIYGDRPQTCRDYDCRIFTACGIEAGGEEKHDVNLRVTQWRFEYPSPRDRADQEALHRAVHFLRSQRRRIGETKVPDNPTRLALLAIRICDLFADPTYGTNEAELGALAASVRALIQASSPAG